MAKSGAPSAPVGQIPADASAKATEIPRRRDAARHDLFAVVSGLTLFLTDAIALVVAFFCAYQLRDIVGIPNTFSHPPRETSALLISIATGSILIVLAISGSYRHQRAASRMDQAYRIISQVSLGLLLAIAATSLALGADFIYSRQMVAYGWVFAITGVTTGRFVHTSIIGRLRARGVASDRLLIVGAGSTGRMVLDKIRRSPQLGYQVVGFVRHAPIDDELPTEIDGMPVLGMTSDLAQIADEQTVDEIIIALAGIPHEEILDMIYAVTELPISVRVYPESFRLLTSDSISIGDLNGLPTVSVRRIGLRRFDHTVKRILDIAVSATALIVFAPLMLVIALIIKLTSPGPVFFAQERVGQDGRAFQLLKFRSMPVDAEDETGPVWAVPDDPRPTRFGRFLRRYSLDELPQFINVLLGEMSVVGPRPERPYFVEQFSQLIPAYMARHHEKSGVTGWAQVNGLRGDTSIEERTRYDLYYVENWSILFDLKIIVKTIFHIFRSDSNAY
ncbi:MAG: undecaprenyl-phosphate glucose phosphotransferase [Thermomicrobiales bacterium]|nr:undecaprenyl-phosphate glucose phosphotransferase [Thermomicrobiales bacterium]